MDLNRSAGGADNRAKPSRQARLSARLRRLLRERCAQRNKARSAKAIGFGSRKSKVQIMPQFRYKGIAVFDFLRYNNDIN